MTSSMMGLQHQAAAMSQDTVDYSSYLQQQQQQQQRRRSLHPHEQHSASEQNASFTSTKGLLNGPGQNNCFLNSAVQAQLLQREKHICGGTIISERWILSAAHCVEFLTADCLIITGSDRVSKGGKRRRITNVIVHPAYDTETNDNDIALIQLEKKIKFDEDQKPIELAERVPRTGEIMTISGFGKKGENAEYATSLEVTTVPVVDYETCRMKYVEDPITENMFCAGNGSADACEGDSGGPAVIDEVLVGVISAGMKCSDTFYPGIYTRVANYRQWINDTVNGQLPKHPNVPASHSEYRPIHVIVTLLCKVFNTIVQFFG